MPRKPASSIPPLEPRQRRALKARAFALLVACTASVGAYAGSRLALGAALGLDPDASSFVAGGLVALGLGPLRRMLRRPRRAPGLDPRAAGWRGLAEATRSAKDLSEVARLIASRLQQGLDASQAFVWLPPPGDASLHLVAGQGPYPTTLVLPEFSLREWLASGQHDPWLVGSSADGFPSAFDQLMFQVGARACLPLTLHGELIGLATIGARRSGLPYGSAELRAMAEAAPACAQAIAPFLFKAEQALHRTKLEAVSRLYLDAQKKAVTDGLTGLTTHLHFQEQLAKRFFEARRFEQPLSLMFIDIDHFKRINDTYGHPTGDEVLREVSRTVQASARACDTVARYGGEELAVILPQTEREGAAILAERLREALQELEVQETSGPRRVRLSASIGVAQLQDEDLTPGDLLERADRAVYAAKRQGRNQVICAG
ncbi:MAG TPA: GGDEF domain-containing protein [Pantanalinema sp.]